MTRQDRIDWILHYAMRGLPMSACSAMGARLAPRLGKAPHPGQHANAKALFAALRPDWACSEVDLEAAVDRLWANIGRTLAEFAVSHRMLNAGRVEIAGRERLDAALASGRPIVALFAHLGNWEMSEMQVCFAAPHRVSVIVAPPARQARAAIAARVRGKAPVELLPLSRSVWRGIVDRLQTPGGIAMLAADEQIHGHVMGPALGRAPRLDGNLGKAARLALMTGAIVLPFYNERKPGARFVTHILPWVELEGRPGDPVAIAAAVQRLDAVMREPILRHLDQWYMALFATAA